MSFIKSVTKYFLPESIHTVYAVATDTDVLQSVAAEMAMNQIIKALADQYVQDFGDEILKQIQQKTIEQKVISKVVENLRRELKK